MVFLQQHTQHGFNVQHPLEEHVPPLGSQVVAPNCSSGAAQIPWQCPNLKLVPKRRTEAHSCDVICSSLSVMDWIKASPSRVLVFDYIAHIHHIRRKNARGTQSISSPCTQKVFVSPFPPRSALGYLCEWEALSVMVRLGHWGQTVDMSPDSSQHEKVINPFWLSWWPQW